MDNELQQLLRILYGDRKMDDKALASYTKQWDTDHNGFRTIIRNAASDKIKQQAPVIVDSKAAQVKPTLVSVQHDAENINPIEPKRAANDMSAIADFKQAFRQAHQGGHKTFFWKKTKANPSGMFSTEIVSQNKTEEAAPQQSENVQQSAPQKAKITAQLDMNKVNSVMPQYQKPIYNHPYNFDKTQAMIESTKDGLARQFRTNNIPRPMGNPGQNVMGNQYNENYPYSFKKGGVAPSTGNGSFVDTIIEALNNNTDIKTISSLIQQSGQSPEALIQEIVSRAQEGDQAAAMAFSNLEKLMKNNTVAKLGTKLNYIQKLKGICPEGTEKVYLQKGGCMCKQKAKEGTELKPKKMNQIQKFKSARFGSTLDEKKPMPTKYDEKKHERLAIGEAMGKNNKAQQDSLKTYRNLFNKQSNQTKYNMGDQKAGYKLNEKTEKKSCGGSARKHLTGGEFYFNQTNPMRMSNGRNVVGIVNKERFKNPTNIGVSQTVYDQQGIPVVQKDRTSNGGEREIYYNVPKPVKRKGLFGPSHIMRNDTVYISGTPEMFENAPNMSTPEKTNQAYRFAQGM